MSTIEAGVTNADGVVETQADGSRVLRFERQLKHPVDRVWAALTEPERLRDWWGAADELELVEGGRIVLRWLNTDDDGNHVVLHGKITRIEPPRLLECDTDVHGVLRFELRDDGGTTVLRFSSAVGLSPERVPENLAGWHMHLNFLADALEGRAADLVELPMDQWRRWRDQYRQS